MIKRDDRGVIDYFILVIVFILCAIGVVMVYSAGSAISSNTNYYVFNHFIKLMTGFILLLIFSRVDYHWYQQRTGLILGIAFIGLILAFLPKIGIGSSIRNTYRWVNLGFVNVQPSEFFKLSLILYLADGLTRKQWQIRSFGNVYLPYMLVTGLGFLLILKQPDFGTATAIGLIAVTMMFLSGVPKRYLLMTALSFLPLAGYLVWKEPYRWKRMLVFLNPEHDPTGIGYQINQSLISIGKGGLFGCGIGQSSQKMFYLPEPHTDFVFSIFSEEVGYIGTLFVMMLFVLLLYRGFKIAKSIPDLFGYLLAGGIVVMISIYAVVNLGVVSALLPTKGLTLPFISFGGSAMLVNMIGIGVLLNITRHVLPVQAQEGEK